MRFNFCISTFYDDILKNLYIDILKSFDINIHSYTIQMKNIFFKLLTILNMCISKDHIINIYILFHEIKLNNAYYFPFQLFLQPQTISTRWKLKYTVLSWNNEVSFKTKLRYFFFKSILNVKILLIVATIEHLLENIFKS